MPYLEAEDPVACTVYTCTGARACMARLFALPFMCGIMNFMNSAAILSSSVNSRHR